MSRLAIAPVLVSLCTLVPVYAQQPIPEPPTEKHPGEVIVDYDRFSGKTNARLRFMEIDQGFYLYASVENEGKELIKPESALIGLMKSSPEWQYLRCQHVALLVDGRPVTDLPSKYNGDVRSGGVTETFMVFLHIDDFLRMANAKTVEWQVCTTEFGLKPEHIIALRDLASRMKARQ